MGTAAEEVVVYTRPGCPFCTLLRRGLRIHSQLFGPLY